MVDASWSFTLVLFSIILHFANGLICGTTNCSKDGYDKAWCCGKEKATCCRSSSSSAVPWYVWLVVVVVCLAVITAVVLIYLRYRRRRVVYNQLIQ